MFGKQVVLIWAMTLLLGASVIPPRTAQASAQCPTSYDQLVRSP